MNEVNFLNENTTLYLGIVLAILSLLPWILTYTIFRMKNKRVDIKKLSKKEKIIDLASLICYVISIFIMIITTKKFDIKNANIWFGIMSFFYIIYYEMYIRYIVRGRNQKELYGRLLYVKIPFFISMSMSLVFSGIWSKNIPLVISSILFTLTNCYSSYNKYIKFFTEYRDLYDDKRKFTGKKMLKDGILPKGLKYVTVVVFIFNPQNKKWLMQKRSKDKGGKWATTSGHPVSGQTSLEGMVTEIKEELGMDVDKEQLKFITTVDRKEKFADIYYLEENIDLKDLHIQQEEVEEVRWMSNNEIDTFYLNNKFKKTHYNYYKEMKKHIKKNR